MDKSEYLKRYGEMVVIRHLEERASALYQQGKIGGFLHLYSGQEAVSTGLISARQPQDRVITAYRDHGVAINCGVPAKQVMAELLSKNFFGGHAIVGSHLPIATGLALGDRYQHNDAVTICMFGDGATNIGFFHEALNLSKVWSLSVLWVVENNQYGMGTTIERASAVSELTQKAEAYGMAHAQIDGMNMMAVHDKAKEMIETIRKGAGPMFLEATTYRYHGHSMGDPERYRKAEEVHKWQESDPIGIYRHYLTDHEIATEQELDGQEKEAERIVEEAVQFAESSPEPAPEALYENIYVSEEC
jgi:pyruvate dehydrogenase E1 component alpha subunit